MQADPSTAPRSTALPATNYADVDVLAASFKRGLHARNMSPRTVTAYLEAVNQLAAFLRRQGMPTELPAIHREHVEAFIADILQRYKPATANQRHRSLQQFFKWAVEEGEIRESPMIHMKPPLIPEVPAAVRRVDELRRVLKACEGQDFEARRDTAIVRLFCDTGIRRDEMAGIKVDDLDLELNAVEVLGKGRRPRAVPFGSKTAQALDRYLRIRAQRKDAASPWLWLGKAGPLTWSGIYRLIRRRGVEAGIPDLHPHQLRHSFAHSWLSAGGSEVGLMRLAGWRSRTMLGRYGASAADERAHQASRRLALGDAL
jgi:site-specific recombinase XerD